MSAPKRKAPKSKKTNAIVLSMFEVEILRNTLFESLKINDDQSLFTWNREVRMKLFDAMTLRMTQAHIEVKGPVRQPIVSQPTTPGSSAR